MTDNGMQGDLISISGEKIVHIYVMNMNDIRKKNSRMKMLRRANNEKDKW
jgi:hypothetical protein